MLVWGYAPQALRFENVTSLRALQPSHPEVHGLYLRFCHSRCKAGLRAAGTLSASPVSADRAPKHLSAPRRISRPAPVYQPPELGRDNVGRTLRASASDGTNGAKTPSSSGNTSTKGHNCTSQPLATQAYCDESALVSNDSTATDQNSAAAPGVNSRQQHPACTPAGKPSESALAAEVASDSRQMEKALATALARLPRRASSALVLEDVTVSLSQMSR